MPGPSVLAVLVAHASRTRIAEALRSVDAQTYPDIQIVVAAIGELTVPEGSRATVVQVREGAGFAEAVTGVLQGVRTEGFDYVLLLHDDVSLDPDVVERLVATAQADPAIAAVGAKLVEWYEPEVLQEMGAAIDRFAIRRSALDAGEVDAGQRDETSDVLFCSDACLLVQRSAFLEVGGFDVKAWPFYEDVDLCWRFRSRGARVVVDPSARVRHAADLSRGRRLFEGLALREHAEHGRLRFMFKHYAPLGLVVLLPQLFVAGIVRLLVAIARRELWRVRVIVGAWTRTIGELPSIIGERRRRPDANVEDRELLALAARGAVGDVRGDRSEWASRFFASIARVGARARVVAREPVTWLTAVAIIVVIALLRKVIFGGTFALGEVRMLTPFGDAIADHLGSVRREGLDPFGPDGPGLIVLGLVRSFLMRASLAEKVVLLLPLWLAGSAGARWGRSLGFTAMGRRWLAVVAAVNPVTLALLRDGSVGPLMMWSASLWLAAQMLVPTPVGEGLQGKVRFVARWAFGFAVTVALHPPALIWLCVLGLAIVLARRPQDDGADLTRDRMRILVSGAIGAFLLLLPWSLEWLTLRSPLVGRPGWLVHSLGGGLARATLGAGWPLLAWLVVAVAAAFYVGLDRTTYVLAVLAGLCMIAGTTGAFPRETMLAATGVCAFLIVSIVARHIVDELPRYELGSRQVAVIAGIVAVGVLWAGGVVHNVPGGARSRTVPVVAGVDSDETGRVLWLAQTTGGVRAWSTLSFSDRLGAFPPPAGPEERLVTKAVEAARAGRTHRLGGVLALADISHIVSLDEEAGKGLGSQSDLGPQEEQGSSTVYRNDAWRGPAMLLAAPPTDPLSPAGLADVVRDPRRVQVTGWPYGPISMRLPEARGGAGSGDIGTSRPIPRTAVLYVASGHRGGLHIEGASGRITAAGAYVPASDVRGTVDITPPGRWWPWMVPLQILLIVVLLGAWITAAYIGSPLPRGSDVAPDLRPITMRPAVAVLVPAGIALALVLGWAGISWGIGTPFLSSAWYCPPIGSGFQQRIGIVNPSDRTVQYQVRPSLTSPDVVTHRITGGARHTLGIEANKGAVIESYGRRLVVATEVSRLGDRDSSLCASDTRSVNIFPEGGRAATRAVPRLFERYILYNPFPDLARASVRFVANTEQILPPRLQDVEVKPGQAVVVDPEEQFEPMLDLSTTVRVWQGRAIVARRLRTEEQVSWSLPVNAVVEGTLPRAQTKDGSTDLIAVNLSEDPIRVNVFGAGRTGSLEEDGFDIDGGRRASFDVGQIASRGRDLVIGVEAEEPIAIESLVAPDDRSTVSLMPPLDPERNWIVPIAEERELTIVNPNNHRVRVEVQRLGADRRRWTLNIDANRVGKIKMRLKDPFGVSVRSSGGGVVVAAIGDRGTIPGVPSD